MARQGMHKLFAREELHLYTDNEKSKIITTLNTVSMILLYWYILRIGATVSRYLLLRL